MANPDAHPEVMRRPAAAIAPRAGRKQRVFKGTQGSRSAAQKKQQIVTVSRSILFLFFYPAQGSLSVMYVYR